MTLRVVVADDETDVCLMLRIQLGAQPDIDVVGVAADGAEALSLCRQLMPDVVVMDLLMPVMNGFQAIESLQQELPGVALVAYTGVAGEFVRQEMERVRVPLVLKSGDISPLADAVRKAATNR
ncbi:MAG: two-component system, NarL family, nitrate/nitrite response regulator NarL [Actinomycetota bacterium]|jgi:DNA-binding NarL/FixJ family response regulator|nr:two-component system, NarL family, nitrate/nitrite response regulator NarL [Actinomycetota bacterium]